MSETLDAIKKELERRARVAKTAVNRAGMTYQHDVQRIAPVDTGQYRASMRTKMIEENGNPFAIVGTPLPQACRLEFGFWDMMDSLGRHYYQRAQPHFRPALDLNREKYVRIMKDTFDANSEEMLVGGEY